MTKLTLNHYISKDEITSPEILEKIKEKFVEIGARNDKSYGAWERIGVSSHRALGIDRGEIFWLGHYELINRKPISLKEFLTKEELRELGIITEPAVHKIDDVVDLRLTKGELLCLYEIFGEARDLQGLYQSLSQTIDLKTVEVFNHDEYLLAGSLSGVCLEGDEFAVQLDEVIHQFFNEQTEKQERLDRIEKLKKEIAELEAMD